MCLFALKAWRREIEMSKNDDGKEKWGKTDKKSDWELMEHCSKPALRECKLTIVASGRQIPFCLHGCIAEHAPSASCSVIICLLFHISLAPVLVHPSAPGSRRWNTLCFAWQGCVWCEARWLPRRAFESVSTLLNCSCCFCNQGWWEGSQQQPGVDGQRGTCLGGVWLKSTGTRCAQSHSGLRLSVGQWDQGNGFILLAHKGGDQGLALMHRCDPTVAGWSQTDFCSFLLFFLCFPLTAALPY